MTVGYPDFQAYANWQSPGLLANNIHTLGVGLATFNVQQLNHYRGVRLRWTLPNGSGTVRASWYTDTTLATQITQDSFNVNTAQALDVIIPAKGPVFQMTVSVVTQMTSVFGQEYGSNIGGPGLTYPVANNWFDIATESIAANSFNSHYLPWVQGGLAVANFTPADATGKINCLVVRFNPDGTVGDIIADLGFPTAAVTQLVALPDDTCGVQVKNTDGAAAHSVASRLVAGASRT